MEEVRYLGETFRILFWIIGLSSGFIYWIYKIFFDFENTSGMVAVTGWVICPIFGVFGLALLLAAVFAGIIFSPGIVIFLIAAKINNKKVNNV